MTPNEFKEILEHLHNAYSSIADELKKSKKEIKELTEELVHLRNSTLSTRIGTIPHSDLIKWGEDWSLEGDPFLELIQIYSFRFTAPICNCRVSRSGILAFTCSGKIFVYMKDTFYVVEGGFEIYHPKDLKRNLVDWMRRPFDFYGDDLILYDGRFVTKYVGMEKEWFLEIPRVQHLRVDGNLIYIGVEGGAIHAYTMEGEFMTTIRPLRRNIENMTVRDGYVLTQYENDVVLEPGADIRSESRIFGADFSGNTVYVGEESGFLRKYQLREKRLDCIKNENQGAGVLAVMKFGSYLIISRMDRTLVIRQEEGDQKEMKMILMDNIVEMGHNGKDIYLVDNNGGLRVFRVKK